MKIPIPSGLKLPPNAEQVPFDLAGKFIVIGGKIIPLSLNGVSVNSPEGEEEEEEEEEEEGYEEGGEGYEESEEGHGKGCGCEGCQGEHKKNQGSSFMIAIETALSKKKK